MNFSFFKRILVPTFFISGISSILLIIVAFAIAGFLIYISGADPLEAYIALGYGIFGSFYSITENLVIFTPILLSSLGLLFAFKCGVWNIGSEGQIYFGAMIVTFLGVTFTNNLAIHPMLQVPMLMVVGFLSGAAWGAIPGVLKAKRDVNEIITTLMMVFIAIMLVHWAIRWPLDDPNKIHPASYDIAESAFLPIVIPGSRVHAGFAIAIICTVITYIIFKKTPFGFSIKIMGLNPRAAKYAGVNTSRMIILVMIISGGLAGVAGACEVCGIHHYLMDKISPGYGFLAIAAVFLAGLNPLGTVLTSLFFGCLLNGARYMQTVTGISTTLIDLICGLIILFAVAREILLRLGFIKVEMA